MTRTQIINELIKKYDYKSFLEIGVDTGFNRRFVNCKEYVGVDPNAATPATHHMTSDEYFFTNTRKFDIIFVDGLHEAEQVYRDIKNALKHLNEGGTIVCHDMSPIQEIHQRVPRVTQIWNGDCWKALVQLRTEHNNLEILTVDTDWGCGVIRKGKQPKLKVIEPLTYENLEINRKKWLNLISVDEFVNKFNLTKH